MENLEIHGIYNLLWWVWIMTTKNLKQIFKMEQTKT